MILHATPARPHRSTPIPGAPSGSCPSCGAQDWEAGMMTGTWRCRPCGIRGRTVRAPAQSLPRAATVPTYTEPSPLDLEIAQAETAATERARAALHARPPERCQRCNGEKFYPEPRDGYWRCRTCHGGTPEPLVTAVEEHAAIARARAEARAAVLAPGDAWLRRQAINERLRDRRPLREVRAAMRSALLHRMLPDRYALTPAGREFAHHRVTDLVQHHLELTGHHEDPRALRARELAPLALFTGRDGWTRAQGFHTTKDFPGLLDGIVRQVYLDSYQAAPSTFPAWTRSVTVVDFQTAYVAAPGFPELVAVGEHGEITRGVPPVDPSEPVRLQSFMRIIALTRQIVVNSDLLSFAALVDALGVAASALEADTVYALLVRNPVLADGQALFSAAHKNLMAAGALDATTLAAATSQLAQQAATGGTALHLRAAYLLVGTALGSTARELAVKQMPPTGAAEAGALTVLQDDRIPGAQWYVVADPAQCALIVTAHLQTEPTPTLEARDHWSIDAREYRGRNDFAAAVMDYRAAVLTPAP
jgi:ribosomal protein L37AE/L43A